jgi:HAE1 family hydrophobic/amphiphilic exporter-1
VRNLKIKDVANDEFGSSMYDIYSNLNGKPSAAIVLKQSFGSNANQVVEDAKIRNFKKKIPQRWIMKFRMMFLKFLDTSIEKVIHTLIEALSWLG